MAWDYGQQRWRILGLVSCLLGLGILRDWDSLASEQLDLPQLPPYLTKAAAPNLIITLDDSVDMNRAYAPESLNGGTPTSPAQWRPPHDDSLYAADPANAPRQTPVRYATSPDVNSLYYDPFKTYLPPTTADGAAFAHARFDAADEWPFPPGGAPGTGDPNHCPAGFADPLDLRTGYRAVWDGGPACGELPEFGYIDWDHAGPAYYDLYDATNLAVSDPDTCTRADASLGPQPNQATPDLCFERILVGSPEDIAVAECRDVHGAGVSLAAAADCIPRDNSALGPGTDAELAQRNFANWYVYYRTRLLRMQTVLSRAMQGLDASVRLTFQGLDEGAGVDVPEDGGALGDAFGEYSAAARQRFYDWLFALRADRQHVALVASEVRAGEFVTTELSQADDIVAHVAGTDFVGNDTQVRCRRNLHLLFTASAWDDDTMALCPASRLDTACWSLANRDGGEPATRLPANTPSASPRNPFGVDRFDATGDAMRYTDPNIGMLADAAFYYWANDLWPDYADEVPPLITESNPDRGGLDASQFWNPKNDPANWQHLTTHIAGLAPRGNVIPNDEATDGTYDAGAKALSSHGFPAVADPGAVGVGEKLDDLWHAALNGRGSLIDATEPGKLSAALAAISTVSAPAGGLFSSAGGAYSTGSLSSSTRFFQGMVDTDDWSGRLLAFAVSQGIGKEPCPEIAAGGLCDPDTPLWDAGENLPAEDDRVILTLGQNDVIPFDDLRSAWHRLSLVQQRGLLGCTATPGGQDQGVCSDPAGLAAGDAPLAEVERRVQYLRGDQRDEAAGATPTYRARTRLLGDIIGSPPVVVGRPASLYLDDGLDDGYGAYRRRLAGRTEMVYVGANDGMLHGFRTDDGAELFAYVPRLVYGSLAGLAEPTYRRAKAAFVDGPIAVGDARVRSRSGAAPAWRTVLVGSLGMGAQGIYALDVTDPEAIHAGAYQDLVLWELSDAEQGAADLGYVFSAPAIARIATDAPGARTVWVVLVGNGYNSASPGGTCPTNCAAGATGNAVLYVIALDPGGEDNGARILKKLDTGQPSSSATPDRANGLAQVTAVDADGDLIADFAYAGDLLGNVWKFDLHDLTAPRAPLFTAMDDDGNSQPITAPIAVARHPSGVGTLLLFGTGRYLEPDDGAVRNVQSIYGIWDRQGLDGDDRAPTRAMLLRQRFEAEVRIPGDEEAADASLGRTSTGLSIDWSKHRGWYIDLALEKDLSRSALGPTTALGERVVSAPRLRGSRVELVSVIPPAPCSSVGQSWLNVLDVASGGRPAVSPFDYNGDAVIDSDDLLRVPGGDDRGTRVTAGTSIRLLADGGAGLYRAPAALLVGAQTLSTVFDSTGELWQLLESSEGDWQNWHQLQ